jgi:hypothetical protein
MTPKEVKAHVCDRIAAAGPSAPYEPRCTDVWVEQQRPRVWGVFVQYFSPGSEVPIDGSTIHYVDDGTGDFVAQPSR